MFVAAFPRCPITIASNGESEADSSPNNKDEGVGSGDGDPSRKIWRKQRNPAICLLNMGPAWLKLALLARMLHVSCLPMLEKIWRHSFYNELRATPEALLPPVRQMITAMSDSLMANGETS
ncbi:Pectinesterase [Psidium guajava]|nr:Pectinesterase [Psidium guajava]